MTCLMITYISLSTINVLLNVFASYILHDVHCSLRKYGLKLTLTVKLRVYVYMHAR